jgi:hypothetical protein
MRVTRFFAGLLGLSLVRLCAPSVAQDFPSFGVPYIPGPVTTALLEGVAVQVDSNIAGSVSTATFIIPKTPEPPRIAPPLTTEEDWETWGSEFIDEHPEFFATPSSNLMRLNASLGSIAWRITSVPHYLGTWLMGGFLVVDVLQDGRLHLITARLIPSADLDGLDPNPALSSADAASMALAAHGDVLVSLEPQLFVAFRWLVPGKVWEPFLAWEVFLGLPDPIRPESPPITHWVYLLDADTGEVLATTEAGIPFEQRTFVRGDSNQDGAIDISDPVFVLNALFVAGSGVGSCADASDANDDGTVDISDAIYALRFLFLGGEQPPRPYPDPGADSTPDSLACALRA